MSDIPRVKVHEDGTLIVETSPGQWLIVIDPDDQAMCGYIHEDDDPGWRDAAVVPADVLVAAIADAIGKGVDAEAAGDQVDPDAIARSLVRWVDRLTAARTAALEWATTILRSPGDMPVADVASQLRQIFNTQPAEREDGVPPGQYAQGARSPIAWAFLCPTCAGYAPITAKDYNGALSGHCQGCGSWSREVHRFAAYIDSRSACGCRMGHERVVGDLPAVPDRAEGGAS